MGTGNVSEVQVLNVGEKITSMLCILVQQQIRICYGLKTSAGLGLVAKGEGDPMKMKTEQTGMLQVWPRKDS